MLVVRTATMVGDGAADLQDEPSAAQGRRLSDTARAERCRAAPSRHSRRVRPRTPC